MSVLIKDMTHEEFWNTFGEFAFNLSLRGKAVELPPHGNLIDGDKLYKDITESILLTDGFKEAFEIFYDEQEIVIPADESSDADMVCSVRPDAVEVVRCKDCECFDTDAVRTVGGVPLIVAHNVCRKWAGGCKTEPNGYCSFGTRRKHDPQD